MIYIIFILITFSLTVIIYFALNTFTSSDKQENEIIEKNTLKYLRPLLIIPTAVNKALPINFYRKKYIILNRFAGDPLDYDADEFLSIRYLCAIAIATLVNISLGSSFLYVSLGLLVGFYLPNMRLNSIKTERENTFRRELPTFIDFMNLVIKGGTDFNMAIKKSVDHLGYNAVTNLFKFYLNDTQMGTSRENALEKLKENIELEEFYFLISSLIQANKLGMNLTQVLSTQADQMRIYRLRAAEKMASKAPVKILLPMMLFIFPALLIIIMAPIFLKIQTVF